MTDAGEECVGLQTSDDTSGGILDILDRAQDLMSIKIVCVCVCVRACVCACVYVCVCVGV